MLLTDALNVCRQRKGSRDCEENHDDLKLPAILTKKILKIQGSKIKKTENQREEEKMKTERIPEMKTSEKIVVLDAGREGSSWMSCCWGAFAFYRR